MSPPATSSLRLAEYIRSNVDSIIAIWEQAVKAALVAATVQTEPALRDSLPVFLENLAKSCDPKEATDVPSAATVCRLHGRERAELPLYSLEATLKEYAILRSILLAGMATSFTVLEGERETILTAIDDAMQQSAGAFVSTRTAREIGRAKAAEGRIKEMEAEGGERDQFVSTLSHDLRGPLGSVRMGLDLLLEEVPQTPSVLELAAIMQRNIAQAGSLISTLLDVNWIKSGGQLPLYPAECNLREIALQSIEAQTMAHGARFRLHCDGDLFGYWSSDHLVRVLENLLTNAVKYGAPGAPISLTLALRHGASGKGVEIAVHNEGRAIPVSEQANLFLPYGRSRAAQEGAVKGWGLGLTLVKGVAEAHGGSVEVVSSPGSGTTFRVNLPQDVRPLLAQRQG